MTNEQKIRFPSRVDLDEEARSRLVEIDNVVLASLLDLASQVKQAHWNIKGPQFFARHQLFDELAKHLREWADDVAERAATLGGYAEGTVRLAAEGSVLEAYDLRAVDGRQHLAVLAKRYGKLSGMLRESVKETVRLDDPVSEDLFVEILRGLEVDLWFLESHLLH